MSGKAIIPPRKNTTFLISEKVMAYFGWPRAVKLSTKAYWKESGITPSINTRMPHTDFSAISSFCVKRLTNGAAQNSETTVIVIVNTRQDIVIHSSARFISQPFFAP